MRGAAAQASSSGGDSRRHTARGVLADLLKEGLEDRLADVEEALELELRRVREVGRLLPELLRGARCHNGACYRGESLTLVCARLGIRLVHAAPYDAPARGNR